MGMKLKPEDLLPDESCISTKSANMVISLKEHGLSQFCTGPIPGFKGKEAIGGKCHLTNFRIIFKSHGFNRARGRHTIFLPNINEVSSSLLKLCLTTPSKKYEFVMWFKKGFINQIKDAQTKASSQLDHLKQIAIANPNIIGSGLEKHATLNSINNILAAPSSIGSIIENCTDPDVVDGIIELVDLLGKDKSDSTQYSQSVEINQLTSLHQSSPAETTQLIPNEIYIHMNGQQFGPYSPDQIRNFQQTGGLTTDTNAWDQNSNTWIPLSIFFNQFGEPL